MADLWAERRAEARRKAAPLAVRLRPRSLDELVGQTHIVGEGKLLDNGSRAALQVKTDDRVIFSSYAGTEIKVEGEEYLILDESDILAVVEA